MMSPLTQSMLALGLGMGLALAAPAGAQDRADTPKADSESAKPSDSPKVTESQKANGAAPAKKAIVQKRFPSAEAATKAFVDAVRSGNTGALLAILGSDGRALLASGDSVADREVRRQFVKAYDESNALVARGSETIIQVGEDQWPFPIPLVEDRGGWRFDTKKGREEILARRIGRNESHAVQTALAYVDAQREYYAVDRNGDGVLEYAQKFASAPGARDGLYWKTDGGESPSPLGPLIQRAHAEGYRRAKNGPTPYHGYLYRILTGQGPNAADGPYGYVERGHMIAGFGLVAFPASYGRSGVMTFIVNQDGRVYQKDFGPDTPAIAGAMKMFDPDSTWTTVEPPQ
jgi:hypothetical protein